ncbi:hypothetical protein ALC62_07076 [Cyphomyrmex costatus]|uniref:Uncharacterized protein n=1 Tax=Cyphomyrmex costatus TaxID=456900 RepID=A0A195CMW6_9HYME|nr:hypothetical protein ALC62_07076 [Cyphomyrmex costatus]
MTTYLKFKGDLQAIVKLETSKVTIEQVPLNDGEQFYSTTNLVRAVKTPNRNAFHIQVEITQTNRYCSSLT